MTKDQEVLMAVVLDYLQTSQKDARQSKACCNAILHLVNSLSTEQLQSVGLRQNLRRRPCNECKKRVCQL
jgi:hypothetical protein